MLIQLLLLAALLLLSGFFSGTETAFTSLSALQIEELAETQGRRGRLVRRLTSRTDLLLPTILIGNNLANVGASALATGLAIRWFGSAAVGAVTGVMTLLILIFGEITPKHIAILNNEPICLATAPFIYALSFLFRPVIAAVGALSRLTARLLGARRRLRVTLQSILRAVRLAEAAGVLESDERRMVKNVFRLNDVSLHTIMTHRTEVFSLERSRTVGEAAESVIASRFSRIPVFSGNPEHIVGVVLARDLLGELYRGGADTRLGQIMMEPILVPQSMKADEMLRRFKKERLNMAVVIDEFGGLAGVVTQEDIVEEIFGELYDEHEAGGEKIVPLADGRSYRISADTPVSQVRDALDLRLPEAEGDQTVGASTWWDGWGTSP